MRTVILTRPLPVTDGVAAQLIASNIPYLTLPSMQVCAHIEKDFERDLQQNWSNYDGLMFVSQHAVQFAAERLEALGLTWANHVWIAAVGHATAQAARAHWPDAPLIFPPSDMPQDSDGLWQTLQATHPIQAGQRILIVRAQTGRQTFFNYLQAAGAQIDIWACYERTRCIWTSEQINAVQNALQQNGLVISITSQEGLSALLENLSNLSAAAQINLKQQPILTLHPAIAQYAARLGFQNAHIAPAHQAAVKLSELARA